MLFYSIVSLKLLCCKWEPGTEIFFFFLIISFGIFTCAEVLRVQYTVLCNHRDDFQTGQYLVWYLLEILDFTTEAFAERFCLVAKWHYFHVIYYLYKKKLWWKQCLPLPTVPLFFSLKVYDIVVCCFFFSLMINIKPYRKSYEGLFLKW